MSAFGFGDLAFLGAAGGSAYDAEAQAYITAVEAADGQALETAVKDAINEFVVGCKADGIWSAIKASCIMAGARTLVGALVPLVGAAPTNFNFVDADYNRKTGLLGNGSTKYLNSNRNNNADPRDNQHLSVYITQNASGGAGSVRRYISGRAISTSIGASLIGRAEDSSERYSRFDGSGFPAEPLFVVPSFSGISRSLATSFSYRLNGQTASRAQSSSTPANVSIHLYRNPNAEGPANCRLAFYSIGEALDLALLDARVTALINAFDAAIQ